MAEILLHGNKLSTVTIIPNYFIDHFMTTANGEFVKIYLYLLRCMNNNGNFSISKVADQFEHTEKDIIRALKYWEKMGLLQLSYNNDKIITGIYFLDYNKNTDSPEEQLLPNQDLPQKILAPNETTILQENSFEKHKKERTLEEIQSFQEKDTIKELIFITEQYLGHTLNSKDLDFLFFWHDSLNFTNDLIEYLIEHSVGKGHKSMHYMNKIALEWKKSDVKTIEDAKKNSFEYSKTYYSVIKAFGIKDRNLIKAEMDYINKWTKQYAFTDDIIIEACERTVMHKYKPDFKYTHSILKKWHQAKIRHLSDVLAQDENYQKSKASEQTKKASVPNKFNNFDQRTYDFNSLEKQLFESTNH